MGDRKFAKLAQLMIILSLNLAPTASTRPLTGEGVMVGGGVALDNVPIPPIGPSCRTNLPISKGRCPPPISMHGPLTGEGVVVGGAVALDHVPIPPIGPSCRTYLPISKGGCPPLPTSLHG
ncbi:hypothetical protein CRYUN_Cryun36dG0069100 [Craigia yunnanensis]